MIQITPQMRILVVLRCAPTDMRASLSLHVPWHGLA